MAVKAQHGPASAFSLPFSPGSDTSWPSSNPTQHSNQLLSAKQNRLSANLSPGTKEDIISPLSAAGPSPLSEAGTIFTDVDSDMEQNEQKPPAIKAIEELSVSSPETPLSATSSKLLGLKIQTQNTSTPHHVDPEEEPPQSVIHIPSGFTSFVGPGKPASEATPPREQRKDSTSRPSSQLSEASSSSTARPETSEEEIIETPKLPVENSHSDKPASLDTNVQEADAGTFYDTQLPTPLQTSLPSLRGEWTKTPRAQTRQDLAAFGRPGSGLARIAEGEDYDASETYSSDASVDEDDSFTNARSFFRSADDEIYELRTALAECWTLCNTLANMSYTHRERIFTDFSTKGNMQGQAWRSCWKLCQNLYESGSEHSKISSRPTLDLCRDFCQTLFDVRVRDNEAADSVLRVSFELNNHLFNTHDRTLPEAFRERTLDFYITLCHRLMKQKSKMVEETDSLLTVCWSLAEVLFSLRQNKREGKKPNEELLGSAIQACWDLSDLFREGWSQIRPDRVTPRPTHTTFSQAFNQARKAGYVDDQINDRPEPETPTTIFDDSVTISPYEAPVPNIMVIRSEQIPRPSSVLSTVSAPSNLVRPNTTQQRVSRPGRMNSMGSSYFGAESSDGTSSRASSKGRSMGSGHTVRLPTEERPMTLLKALFVRAAVQCNRGFLSDVTDGNIAQASLPRFVKQLPDNAFGTQPWQMDLLEKYRSTIAHDASFKTMSTLANLNGLGVDPSKGRDEIAMSVKGMVAGTSGWVWLRDLFRYAFGVYVEEVLNNVETMSNQNGDAAVHKKASSLNNAGINPSGLRRVSAASR